MIDVLLRANFPVAMAAFFTLIAIFAFCEFRSRPLTNKEN